MIYLKMPDGREYDVKQDPQQGLLVSNPGNRLWVTMWRFIGWFINSGNRRGDVERG
jgi:hypothetical protein